MHAAHICTYAKLVQEYLYVHIRYVCDIVHVHVHVRLHLRVEDVHVPVNLYVSAHFMHACVHVPMRATRYANASAACRSCLN